MAHNIARIDGTDQAWYSDKPAWHGLGTVTQGAKTAAQVVRAVPQFRKPVILVPVAIKLGGKWVEDPDMRATVRTGQTSPMGYVTPLYEKLGDEDALAILESVVRTVGERKVKAGFGSAGLLGAKGARGFASIDLTRVFGKKLSVKRDPSRQESWLFGDWTHDGSGAMGAGLWNNRVDCNNMLDMARAYAEAHGLMARIVHKGDLAAQVREAQKLLGMAELTAEKHVALMNALVDVPISKPKAFLAGFTEYVIPDLTDDGQKHERAAKSRDEARDAIAGLFTGSATLVGVPPSAYRAYQAVAEYADHVRPLRIGAQVDAQVAADRRFRSITEGPAADMKGRALDWLRNEFLVPVGMNRNPDHELEARQRLAIAKG